MGNAGKNEQMQAIRIEARLRKMVALVPDPVYRTDLLVSLDDLAVKSSTTMLLELESLIIAAMAKDENTIFESKDEAEKYLSTEVFPKVSANFRLFKTAKLKQDEYIVINRDWLHGHDTYQTYGMDRDVNDRLLSEKLPASVLYLPFPGAKAHAKMNVLSAWRRQPQTQEGRLNTLEYIPGAGDIVGHAFNTFKDVSVLAMEGIDTTIFLDHVRDNLCNGNVAYYEYLMKWLAHLVQKPWERPLTGISIIGGQGTGKGIFIDIIARMLGGRRNANTTASAKDTKSFNTAVGSKLLVVFDEATFSGDHEQSDFMKKLVTEPFVRIEPKGIDAYEVANYARCFITSNNMESSTPADIGARRWLIIECKNDLDQKVLATLATAIGNNGEDKKGAIKNFVNGLMFHLKNLDITDFNPQLLPEQTTGMQTKIHNQYKTDPVFAFLIEWLRAPELTLYRHVVEIQDGNKVERDETLSWDDDISFADFYAVFSEMSKEAHGRLIHRNRIGADLEKWGIKLTTRTGNCRFVELPEAETMLTTLRAYSRFDKLVSKEQEAFIRNLMPRTKAVPGMRVVQNVKPVRGLTLSRGG